jgi:uncharacterized protein
MIHPIVILAACALLTQPGVAQQASSFTQPQIVVSGTADILLPAAQATFSIGITTKGSSATIANAENARITKSVLESLQAAHLRNSEIKASRLEVNPNWVYDEKSGQRKRTGFEATNTLTIDTEHLADVGIYIDAALSAGATNISSIEFAAKDIDSARRQALSNAVAAARSDAEAMAHAGGGTLGELILLSSERSSQGIFGVQQMVMAAAPRAQQPIGTEVIPGQIKVTASVDARWKFVPASPAK